MRHFFLLALLLAAAPLLAQKRYALVVGNGNYTYASLGATPVSDALAMRDALRQAGFEVDYFSNLDQAITCGSGAATGTQITPLQRKKTRLALQRARTVCCAAAVGATTLAIAVPPTASSTGQPDATSTSASVSPLPFSKMGVIRVPPVSKKEKEKSLVLLTTKRRACVRSRPPSRREAHLGARSKALKLY